MAWLGAALLVLGQGDLPRLLFPGTKIVATGRTEPRDTAIAGIRFADALADSPVWLVTGPPGGREKAAALDLANRQLHEQRRVRFAVFPAGTREFALVSYSFPGVHAPGSSTLARAVLLEGGRPAGSLDLSAPGFTIFTSVRLRDLDGDRVPEAIVSRNREGGAETLVLRLGRGAIQVLFSASTILVSGNDRIVLTLDEEKTAASRGRVFHFTKTTWHVGKKSRPSVAGVSFPAQQPGR